MAMTTLDEYGDLLSDDDGTTTSAYQFDALGSTAAALDLSGAVTDRYVYRAFGAAAGHSGASDTPRTFVGQQGYEYDGELLNSSENDRREVLLSGTGFLPMLGLLNSP